ncbi:MAG: efflux transporter periplasmic adaptor subunit, partial [Deltaproteobacteria bacterium CG17_big_fil_post_rev_8_21_14_2_50_51_6]
MKRYIVVAVLVGLAAWQIYVRMSNTATQKAGPRGRVAVAVETAAVRQTTVRDIGIFTGTLYPRSQFVVAPKVAGRLEKLHVKMADRVKKGQVIAEIESEEYLQQLDQAKAELEVARANLADVKSALEIASKELERVKTLRQKRIASESELDASAA